MEASFAQKDVVVVGGGMAGLTTACYLARAGVEVIILEKAPNLGGRAATQTFDDFRFNRGIHALYTGGEASQILQELGVTYDYGVPAKETFVLQGGELRSLPADPLGLLRTDLLDTGDKLALMRLFARTATLKPHAMAYRSVQEWLGRNVRRPEVRRVIAALARTLVYTTALDLVSAEVFLTKLQRSLKHPVHYIDGGWQSLADALRTAAERAGARILTNAHADAVEHHYGRVQGVRLRDGSSVHASAVVVATKPRDAAKLVDGGAHPTLQRVVDGLIPVQIACLDVALGGLPSPRHTIVQDLDGPRFLTTQSLYSRVAPEGG